MEETLEKATIPRRRRNIVPCSLMFATGFINLVFFAFAYLAAPLDKQTFDNLIALGMVQVIVSIACSFGGARIWRTSRFDVAIAIAVILMCGHTGVPLGMALSGKYKGTSSLAIGHAIYATYLWISCALLLWSWSRHARRNVMEDGSAIA